MQHVMRPSNYESMNLKAIFGIFPPHHPPHTCVPAEPYSMTLKTAFERFHFKVEHAGLRCSTRNTAMSKVTALRDCSRSTFCDLF